MLNRIVDLPKAKFFFLFGLRQTGKSTLVRSPLDSASWTADLLESDRFLHYARAPEWFRREAKVKISKRGISGADLSGLRAFQDEHPRVPRAITCDSAEPYELDGVRVFPWRIYLEELPGIVAADRSLDRHLVELSEKRVQNQDTMKGEAQR